MVKEVKEPVKVAAPVEKVDDNKHIKLDVHEPKKDDIIFREETAEEKELKRPKIVEVIPEQTSGVVEIEPEQEKGVVEIPADPIEEP